MCSAVFPTVSHTWEKSVCLGILGATCCFICFILDFLLREFLRFLANGSNPFLSNTDVGRLTRSLCYRQTTIIRVLKSRVQSTKTKKRVVKCYGFFNFPCLFSLWLLKGDNILIHNKNSRESAMINFSRKRWKEEINI